jgi:hypothetical protein
MTPIYFIERWFIDNNGKLVSESQQLLDVLTDPEQIAEASVNQLIRKDQKKEISRTAFAKEYLSNTKKRRSIRPTVKMKAVNG